MTPKEKSHELIVKSLVEFEKLTINEAKKIALIAVDEVINAVKYDSINIEAKEYYWKEVKYEIKKL
jgi:predicted transcriptional regulator